jgi:hypothetical protein
VLEMCMSLKMVLFVGCRNAAIRLLSEEKRTFLAVAQSVLIDPERTLTQGCVTDQRRSNARGELTVYP